MASSRIPALLATPPLWGFCGDGAGTVVGGEQPTAGCDPIDSRGNTDELHHDFHEFFTCDAAAAPIWVRNCGAAVPSAANAATVTIWRVRESSAGFC